MKIVAVSACIAGVAHTYMAKANLEKFAKIHGIEIHVETQGAMGIENKLKDSQIAEADLVIFAVDTKVVGSDRFDNKKILSVKTTDVVRHGEETIMKAISIIEKGEN